jgi:hypothetical protein
MNRGGIPRHRSWGHVFAPQLVEEEQTGVVPPAGEATPTLGAQAWPRPTEIRDNSMTPTPWHV